MVICFKKPALRAVDGSIVTCVQTWSGWRWWWSSSHLMPCTQKPLSGRLRQKVCRLLAASVARRPPLHLLPTLSEKCFRVTSDEGAYALEDMVALTYRGTIPTRLPSRPALMSWALRKPGKNDFFPSAQGKPSSNERTKHHQKRSDITIPPSLPARRTTTSCRAAQATSTSTSTFDLFD